MVNNLIIYIIDRIVNNRKASDMKKSLKTEITKEKILNAAIEEFGTHGYEGATINQICQKHNISKGLIYHNFKNKDELYLCCADEAVTEFISYMEKYNFAADFNFYMQKRYQFFGMHPYYSRLIFSFILTDNEEFAEKIKEIKNKFDSFNRGIYIAAIDKLTLRKGISRSDALQYYTLLQNMLNSYLSTDIISKNDFEPLIHNHEKSLEKILNFVLYGIAEENNE